jgi:hypothetical protein
VRRKALGVYSVHLKKAPIVRELLWEWFSALRFSVLARIPRTVLELKAKQQVQEYVLQTLTAGGVPKPPMVAGKWLRDWEIEYRVSLRRPNRKYKVPKKVLEERLQVFWLNLARIRTLAQLVLGHDLECINLDQSPFHMNEAGSQGAGNLTLRGAPSVPLKECRAATRTWWSACTLTVSEPATVMARLPGLELMFKASGDRVQAKLQNYVSRMGLPWLSVVTGPKGSYREEHVLAFLDRHLEPLHEGRQWKLVLMDAYGPQMSDNVRLFCWHRKYVVVIHGDGATGVTQPNDTGLRSRGKQSNFGRLSRLRIAEPRQCTTSLWKLRGAEWSGATLRCTGA